MLKIPISTSHDLSEAMRLQKRRQFEDERKKRIFNARQRLFGLDLNALERQIAEKTKQRHIDAECEHRYEEQTQKQRQVIYAKMLEKERQRRVINTDINYYRCRFQRKDQSREFDLNDPDYIRNSQPARIADDDIRLGISSAQIFYGEDLHHNERMKRQREQQRAWLDQQTLERKQAEQARLKADRVMMESLHSRDKRLEDMSNSERRIQNQLVDSIQKYNTEMARTKQAQRVRAKQEKNEDDLAEIYNMLTSDMLTENPDVAQSRTDPKKKIAFMYRGMTPDELSKFRDEQHQQRLANAKRDTENQLINKQWEQYALNMDRELMLKQLELDHKKKEKLDDQIRDNFKLAITQRRQREEDNKLMTRNYMAPEFYDQFNKTTR